MGEYGDQSQPRGTSGATPTGGTGVLAELVDEAVVGVDSDGVICTTNSRFRILTGRTDAELVGSALSSVIVESDGERLAAIVRALATQDHGEQTTVGVSLRTDSDQLVACQLSLAVVGSATGRPEADTEIIGTVRPVDTADAELRRRASQQAAVATLGQLAVESDNIDDLMAEAARLVAETLDCSYAKILDLDADEEVLWLRQGVGWQDGTVGDATVEATTNSQAGYTLRTDQPVIVDDLETETRFHGPELLTSHDVISGISITIGSVDAPWGVLGVHDIRHRQFTTDDANFVQSVANVLASAIDRQNRTQELQRYEQIIETVNDGVYTVNSEGRFTMVNEAFCELTGYDREKLLESDGSLLVDDDLLSSIKQLEARMIAGTVSDPTLEGEITTADGRSVVAEATFALVPTDESWEQVGVVRDISERKATQRRLERQHQELTALNEVNTVVRETTDAILNQSTRHEIEQRVCESLVAFDTYQFAWIGEVNPRTDELESRAEAGIEGYLDDVTISTDPEDPLSRGPAGRAIETQELQVTQDVYEDPDFEPWQSAAEAYGYRSLAAIPITHDGTLYGVLGLYSHVADAFSAEKQAVIAQLGEIVGHAIAAVERKQALMSDTVTELTLEIRDVFGSVDNLEAVDARIILDQVVPVNDEIYLQYGRAATETAPFLEQLSREHPACESVTILAETATEVQFELRITEPPVTSIVADRGGSIKQAVIEDNTLRMTVHLPQTADVRRILDRIKQRYPTARPVARRQVNRSETTSEEITSAWIDSLTDRQRASLEAAYFAGFFEWPRNSSGQELAESMGVSPATFHQHLRAAERKLFTVLLDTPEMNTSIPQ